MNAESQQPTRPEGVIPALNAAIEATNLAKSVSPIAPAKTVFGSVSTLLTLIRVRFLLFSDDPPQVHT
jgi:hypothetical protein